MYLIAYYKDGPLYELSNSRNAVKHCAEKNAKQVQVYDKNGWLLSMAEQKADGTIFRPPMYLDGEAKSFYADKYKALKGGRV